MFKSAHSQTSTSNSSSADEVTQEGVSLADREDYVSTGTKKGKTPAVTPANILSLQRNIGNQAVLRLLANAKTMKVAQPKVDVIQRAPKKNRGKVQSPEQTEIKFPNQSDVLIKTDRCCTNGQPAVVTRISGDDRYVRYSDTNFNKSFPSGLHYFHITELEINPNADLGKRRPASANSTNNAQLSEEGKNKINKYTSKITNVLEANPHNWGAVMLQGGTLNFGPVKIGDREISTQIFSGKATGSLLGVHSKSRAKEDRLQLYSNSKDDTDKVVTMSASEAKKIGEPENYQNKFVFKNGSSKQSGPRIPNRNIMHSEAKVVNSYAWEQAVNDVLIVLQEALQSFYKEKFPDSQETGWNNTVKSGLEQYVQDDNKATELRNWLNGKLNKYKQVMVLAINRSCCGSNGGSGYPGGCTKELSDSREKLTQEIEKRVGKKINQLVEETGMFKTELSMTGLYDKTPQDGLKKLAEAKWALRVHPEIAQKDDTITKGFGEKQASIAQKLQDMNHPPRKPNLGNIFTDGATSSPAVMQATSSYEATSSPAVMQPPLLPIEQDSELEEGEQFFDGDDEQQGSDGGDQSESDSQESSESDGDGQPTKKQKM